MAFATAAKQVVVDRMEQRGRGGRGVEFPWVQTEQMRPGAFDDELLAIAFRTSYNAHAGYAEIRGPAPAPSRREQQGIAYARVIAEAHARRRSRRTLRRGDRFDRRPS
jgi:hypothetical protein